jgi:hypothetical protein
MQYSHCDFLPDLDDLRIPEGNALGAWPTPEVRATAQQSEAFTYFSSFQSTQSNPTTQRTQQQNELSCL